MRAELIERLGLDDPLVVARGFDRANLRLEVVRHTEDRASRAAVVDQAGALAGPGLVYVATRRKDTERYAAELTARGLRAEAYHAGRRATDRQAVHERFLGAELDVVVATSAFGMGIDKPDGAADGAAWRAPRPGSGWTAPGSR